MITFFIITIISYCGVKIIYNFSLIIISYFYILLKYKNTDKKYSIEDIKVNDEKTKYNKGQNKKIRKTIINFLDGLVRVSVIKTGKIKSQIIRKILYKYIYKIKIDSNVVIYGDCEIRDPFKIVIGNGSIIGDLCQLDARNCIEIKSNVCFGTGVWIWTEQHDVNSPYFLCNDKGGKVTINDRAWICSRVTILPGVTIGEGAVIATGAVVTKDVEPFSIYAGIPAQKIGFRNRELKYEFDGTYLPFR